MSVTFSYGGIAWTVDSVDHIEDLKRELDFLWAGTPAALDGSSAPPPIGL